MVGASVRAGIAFLLLAWLVTRPAAQGIVPLDSWGVAKCALAGLPLAVLVASLITLRRGTRGGWRRGAAASLVALAVPVAILAASGGHAPGPSDTEVEADGIEAVATGLEEGEGGGRAYKLRVRGLHPLIEEAGGAAARVEIGARMDEDDAGCVIIEAQLLDERSGRTLWSKAYRGDGATPAEIRKIVAEALREAMSLTREGAGGQGQTI
jgi:hypothetical protein